MKKPYICAAAIIALNACVAPARADPDIALCQITAPAQFGRVGEIGSGTIGVSFGTSHYNAGTAPLPWGSLPDNAHPLFTQNMYRMGVVDGSTRFEQIGMSWVFNSYCPLQNATCAACTPSELCGPALGPGCSTPHSAASSASQSNLSSRGHVNPFTGVYPPSLNNHAGHSHNGISHRLQVDDDDLAFPGAVYVLESHAVTPHDSAAGNSFNNVGHRIVAVSGPSESGVFSFSPQGSTIQQEPAIYAWSSATHIEVNPSPGSDGRIIVAYEVSPLTAGLYHYEFAIYNMNNDAGVGAFAVPATPCAEVTSAGFHAVRNHAPEANAPNYSSEPWQFLNADGLVRWSTEPYPLNPNANAIRWGTMYNFRFDAAGPPVPATATLTLFMTGVDVEVAIVGPGTPDALRADFNGDCEVDVSDADAFIQILLGINSEASDSIRADLDGSGTADGLDISRFVSEMLGA